MMFSDFAAYADARRDVLAYREMWPATTMVPKPPAFVFGAMPAALNEMMHARCHVGRIGLWSLRGGLVTRDHIVIHDRHVLTSPATNHPHGHCHAVMSGLGFDPYQRLRPIGGRVISLGGPGWHTWGHWLTDFLPRLYLFRAEGWDLRGLRWLLPEATPAYAFDFLRMLGIDRGSILLFDEREEAVAPGELIVAENFAAGAVMHPVYVQAIQWIVGRLASWRGPGGGPAKVFLSRRSTPTWRGVENREELEAIARRHGYEVVDPATLTARQQVGLVSGATHLAGEYGSALHSSIFANPGTVVTCFRGPTITSGVLQNGISAALGQALGYVIGTAIPEDVNQAFRLDPHDVEVGLETAEALRAG